MKKIAFHCNQFSLRGTEVALYNYAKYNEEILGNKSVIFGSQSSDSSALDKFKDRFEVVLMNFGSYDHYLKSNNFDFLYVIKMGINDGFFTNQIPTIVHAVFRFNDPHGYKYVYVSDWLAKDQGYNPEEYSLPHICEKLPAPTNNLRAELGIKDTDIVFGYYGGSTEFNIEFVKESINEVLSQRSDIKFIFMNINKFTENPNVIFLPGTFDLNKKSSFVNACDAMIHARFGGETFGLAISEFALENKPVITYGLSGERSHIEILGERGIYYNNKEEVKDIFNNLSSYIKHNDYFTPYLKFSPEIIMEKFKKLIS